jgi:hypothetical protein
MRSTPGSKVNRVGASRAASYVHTSMFAVSVSEKASRRPSGAICTPPQVAGVALSGVVLPSRVSQSSGAADAFSPPGRYTSVPLCDTSTCAMPLLVLLTTPGTTGTAGPVTASVARSNGAAKSVPSCTQVRWPPSRSARFGEPSPLGR